MIDAYPLAWPAGWPRTRSRGYGRFGKRGMTSYGYQTKQNITIAQATSRALDELARLGATDVVISSNLRVRNDGLPYSKQSEPSDPGVAVYFELKGKRQCVPCDTYTHIAQNLAGVAASIEALRALERHGSGLMDRAFTGFEALPHLPALRDCWDVLGVGPWSSPEEIERAYQRARSAAHPDKGGSSEAFDEVQRAYEAAIAEVTA
jgi:hypothetical protein